MTISRKQLKQLKQLEQLCEAQRWAEAHVPENLMRMAAQSKDPPELERFAAPKLLIEVWLPTLDEILLGQKAFGYRYFPK